MEQLRLFNQTDRIDQKDTRTFVHSPSDLVRYLASPFASWMDRYYVEHPGAVSPDQDTDDARLIAQTGEAHERAVLAEIKSSAVELIEIPKIDFTSARARTLAAIQARVPVIYQAVLHSESFAGYADFLMLDHAGRYEVWDTKLARSPKAYYALQLCCYCDMLASMTDAPLSDKFGIILGTSERVEFRLEQFRHYYRHIKRAFLAMQKGFTGDLADRPEPLPRAEHGRWASYAAQFFQETDHLVRVAGISVGQIKKLKKAGITTMTQLARASGTHVPRLDKDSLKKLADQAHLQCQTDKDRAATPEAPPRYEVLSQSGANGEPLGLAALPPDHPADVFFDMEGYPLAPGGLEYLFGVCLWNSATLSYDFMDWWAHDRDQEKLAFEGFVDWVFRRWRNHHGLHIYHYANYEVNAMRRLSTRHDTRQDEVDQLLRHKVFVDLYQVVRQGLRIGEESYSIKSVEHLYRGKRATDVATAADSIVQYNRWIESRESGDWNKSPILKGIRDYNEDDCRSTAQLCGWLRNVAKEHRIAAAPSDSISEPPAAPELPPEVVARLETARQLRQRGEAAAVVLADVIEFHRREQKPMWWRMFERAAATPEERRDDPGCIEGLQAEGDCLTEKRSLVQAYRFDPGQECKLGEGDSVRFVHNLEATFTIGAIDRTAGTLQLKLSQKNLDEHCAGVFPKQGALLVYEFVNPAPIPEALSSVAGGHLTGSLHAPVAALLERVPPAASMQLPTESTIEAAIRMTHQMSGGCLVIQGPPGTGKTYAASRVITSLLAAAKTIGIASNSHKAVVNLLKACGEAAVESGTTLQGIKVGGGAEAGLMASNPGLHYVASSGDARGTYTGGVVGGTAWLFSRPEWEGVLDYLFIDEAGQVPLANAIAMARCAHNLILLGDQMQLEQPIQGAHPGDAGLSVLQYALKDTAASLPDAPVFHAVVPPKHGLFLGESRRMHPSVCQFISDSMYESRLRSHPDCARQKIVAPSGSKGVITSESGIVFSAVEHDGNIQQSDEEVERVKAIYSELCGRTYTDKEGAARALGREDFLVMAPYNAQVRALQAALPQGARVGSVDKFQGQEAPVCILSLCSSYGEYGSRGLAFILDRNRINVAISRAQCLAVVVADPRIAGSLPGTLEEMTLINLFCKLAHASNIV